MKNSPSVSNGFAIILMALCLLLAANSGCKKDPEKVLVGAELNSWFNYKPYSYWVMKDTATGKLDSIMCNGISTIDFTGDKKHQYEHKSIVFLEFILGTDTVTHGLGIVMSAWPENDRSIMITDGLHYNPFINMPYEQNGSSLANGEKYQRDQSVAIEYIPSLHIDGQFFDSVYHLTYTYANGDPAEHWYMSRKVGFLMIAQNNFAIKRTLVLKRWNVIHN